MILSQNIPVHKKHSRIISVVPSQTELLSYLRLDEEVVGITKFCVHPEKWFKNKTRVGGTKNLNLKIIDQLSPDLIIANKEENVKEQIEELAKKYDVWVTDVNNLNDAINMISDIGKLTNRIETASALAWRIKEDFEKLKNHFSDKRKVSTAYFIWKDPYMVAAGDTFINEMMPYCGLENIFSEKKRYPEISLEEIIEKKCELILLSSEPYPFKQKHKEEIQNQLPQIKIQLADVEMFRSYVNRLLKSVDYFQSFLNNP
jgi:ABC-type Fe3+-hydroxamate transport system substrate-binding protein